MRRLLSIPIPALCMLAGLAFAAPIRAENTGTAMEQFKGALNGMVQQVHAERDPAVKREIIGRFLGRVEAGTRLADRLPWLPEKDRQSLALFQDKIHGYSAELQGANGREKVGDSGLDPFANYVQQDMEQAASAYWDGGGVYLSVGAIIIILIILILLK